MPRPTLDDASAALPPQQQQLSLFGEAAPSPPGKSHGPSAPDTPLALREPRDAQPAPGTATAAGVGADANTIPLAPEVFRHPQAERELRLGEHIVAYAFKRARRRSIGFTVSAEGLAVSAPRWVGVMEVEAALREKGPWILRKLQEQRRRAQKLADSRIEWRDGAGVPFLGETVILVLDPRVAGAVLNAGADALPGVPRLTLHIGLPHHAEPQQIRDSVQSWLQRQAKRVFEERCRHFAQALGVRMHKLSLSSAQTRWGSASADGSIRLHWRLIHFAMPVIDYVVAHELAHLREMNHSPAFWDVVRSVVPDFERHRGALKHDVLPAFD